MWSSRARAATAAAAVAVAVLLGGCASAEAEAENSRTAQADAALVREAVTGLQGLEGAMRVDHFSDRSCLNSEQPNPQTNSGWLAVLTLEAPTKASTDRTFDEIDAWATAHGYEKKQDQKTMLRTVGWVKPGVSLVARAQMNGAVGVVSRTPCRDHPKSHRLYRDELDPEYGITDPIYEDGQRSASAGASSTP